MKINIEMQPIKEELDLGDQKKAFKGKTIKIKKLVKKETGSFTLKDTYIQAEDSMDTSGADLDPHSGRGFEGPRPQGGINILPPQDPYGNQVAPDQFNFSKQANAGPREVRM